MKEATGNRPLATGQSDGNALQLGRDALGSFEATSSREWLVTNGLGGFASGTIGGANTRRYHGLLIAALRPPVERTVMVAKLDAIAHYGEQTTALATNEYADGTIDPHGYRHLESFRLEGQIPVWTWLIGDARLEQRIWMAHGENTTYLSYTLLRASQALDLELHPLCTYRDYHWQHRGHRDVITRPIERGLEVIAYPGARPYRIQAERGECALATDWYWNFKHRAESERGLDDVEDLFRPAVLKVHLQVGQTSSIVLTTEDREPALAAASLSRETARQAELLARSNVCAAPQWIEQLALAADQFIVERHDGVGNTLGNTVIAGYPWFSDWGRDTMIALPGLTISTGRHEIAASILRTFARFVSEGMLPNVFPDAGDAPQYNTVDATLWYFVAVDEYLRRTGERELRKDLYPVLKNIIAWHVNGTRYGIRVDANDGLLYAGEPGVQLTWMDAKVGDWVITPRIGKPVEINALWYNALMIMRGLASEEKDAAASREYAALAERAARSFNERFWFEQGGYLYDVIDENDASLRPNQLFAVSLRHALLDNGRARSVVDVCARELWTPGGLRSLGKLRTATGSWQLDAGQNKENAKQNSSLWPIASGQWPIAESRYAGRYVGGPQERDSIYHQGTVWSWLLGPFVSAHYRVYGDAPLALSYLDGVAAHLRHACIGQVSEILDGDAPFTPRGCYAQAWGVAEILRAWSEINAAKNGNRSETRPAARKVLRRATAK